jgi:thiol-disulfide isomerase/thioredoxin
MPIRSLIHSLAVLVLISAAAAAGYIAHRYLVDQSVPQLAVPGSLIDEGPRIRPDFSLPDLQGQSHHVGEWDGRVLAVNFWATWCWPCREEIPEFVELQKKYGAQGLQFVGIAIDRAEEVQEFIEGYNVNYPVLLGDTEAIRVAEEFGNRVGVLPFTAIVDRQGRIAFRRAGQLHGAEAEQVILPLLQSLSP